MHSLDSSQTVLTMSEHPEPVLTAASGDAITVETLDCFSNGRESDNDLRRSAGWDQVSAATGPIGRTGASPGGTLRVDVLDIVVEDQGTMTTRPDVGVLPGTVEERTKKVPVIDGHVQFDESYSFGIDPMIG